MTMIVMELISMKAVNTAIAIAYILINYLILVFRSINSSLAFNKS